MTACLSCHQHRALRHFGSGMRKNQNLDFRLFDFYNLFFFRLSFFSFSFLFAAMIDLLLGLLAVKKESVIVTGNFYHEAARCSDRKFALSFSLNF